VLYMDQDRQFYLPLKEDELPQCRPAEPGHHVCSHSRTLLPVPAAASCAVTLLQRRDRVPAVRETRLITISSNVWTQLTNTSWIYYAPHREVMTIVRRNRNPVDIPLEETGKLKIFSGCKGYSTNAILYGISTAGSTSVHLPGDLSSQIEFKYACDEDLGITLNFSQIPARMAHRKAMVHLDELRLTSARVSDLLDRVSGQDWENQLVTHHNTHSVVLYLLGSVTVMYWANKLYFLCAGGFSVARIGGEYLVRTWRYPR
jgi:hypothetical protein